MYLSLVYRNYDPRDVTSENRRSVEKLLKERSDSFTQAIAKRASAAAAPLAAWVKANVRFSYVLEKVKPLESEQNKLQRCVFLQNKIGCVILYFMTILTINNNASH